MRKIRGEKEQNAQVAVSPQMRAAEMPQIASGFRPFRPYMPLRQRKLDIVAGLFAALGHPNGANGPKSVLYACSCQLCVGELRLLGHGKGHEPVFSSILAGNAPKYSLQSDAW